jgi:hypothetical protein
MKGKRIRLLVFACGMLCALLLAGRTIAADDCFAFTAYGDCYIELTGCTGPCQFNPGENGEGSLTGTGCSGFSGACTGNWYFELSWCEDQGGSYICKINAIGYNN